MYSLRGYYYIVGGFENKAKPLKKRLNLVLLVGQKLLLKPFCRDKSYYERVKEMHSV